MNEDLGDSLSAARVLGRAIVLGALGAPIAGSVLSAGWFAYEPFKWNVIINLFAVAGVFCFFLGLCSGVARNVRRPLRPLVLLGLSGCALAVVWLGGLWVAGFASGGPQGGWEQIVRLVDDLWYLERRIELLFSGIVVVAVYLTLGLVQSRALPVRLRGFADRAWLHALAGLIGGGLASAVGLLLGVSGPDLLLMLVLYLGGAIACALGMWVGDRVDGALVRRWRARQEG